MPCGAGWGRTTSKRTRPGPAKAAPAKRCSQSVIRAVSVRPPEIEGDGCGPAVWRFDSSGGGGAPHASGRRRFLGDFRDDVPDQVHYVINRALEPDPANRYQSCGALLDDLNASSPVFVPRPTRSSAPAVSEVRDRFNIRRRTWFAGDVMIWGAAIIAAVLVGVGAIGFMASKAYGVMFGFQGEFALESPGVWLEVGARTLPLVVVMPRSGRCSRASSAHHRSRA